MFFAWTRAEALAPGRSRRWLLAMILLLPLVTASLALMRRSTDPASAWFDSRRLLNVSLFAGFQVWHVVVGIAAMTLVMTLVQEVIPAFFPPMRSDHPVPEALETAARSQPGWGEVDIVMIDDHLAAATGGTPARPRLYLSAALAESFGPDEIEAIVRHEHAHLEPRRWWAVHMLFAARMVQAMNPVAMWVSREYAVEMEIDCDREAVMNGDRRPLTRVLFAIYQEIGGHDAVRRRILQRRIDILRGRSGESYRLEVLPEPALLMAGIVMSALLPWVI